MKRRNVFVWFVFIAASFVQADFDPGWISPKTPLETFCNECEWMAIQDFDVLLNCMSNLDLIEYKNVSARKGECDKVEVVNWILKNKKAFYPDKTLMRPWVTTPPNNCPTAINLFKFFKKGGRGKIFTTDSHNWVMKFFQPKQINRIITLMCNRDNLDCWHRAAFDWFFPKFYIAQVQKKDRIWCGIVLENLGIQDFFEYRDDNVAENCRLLEQAARGIAVLGDVGFVHVDIKPENMMVVKDGNAKNRLKLIDFDSCLYLAAEPKLEIHATREYCAPELLPGYEGGSIVSTAADVYALGMTILHKMTLTSKCASSHEFVDKRLNDHKKANQDDLKNFSKKITEEYKQKNFLGNEGVSAFIGSLLEDCLAYDPKARPTAMQVAEILKQFRKHWEDLFKIKKWTLNYDEVKEDAIKKFPKTFPWIAKRMLLDPRTELREEAGRIISALVNADPEYKKPPLYGLYLLLEPKRDSTMDFDRWCALNPNALKQLNDRIYVYGTERGAGKDLPIPKAIYDRIQREASSTTGTLVP